MQPEHDAGTIPRHYAGAVRGAKEFLERVLAGICAPLGFDVDALLTTQGRERLVLASAGVARDYLSLVTQGAAKRDGRPSPRAPRQEPDHGRRRRQGRVRPLRAEAGSTVGQPGERVRPSRRRIGFGRAERLLGPLKRSGDFDRDLGEHRVGEPGRPHDRPRCAGEQALRVRAGLGRAASRPWPCRPRRAPPSATHELERALQIRLSMLARHYAFLIVLWQARLAFIPRRWLRAPLTRPGYWGPSPRQRILARSSTGGLPLPAGAQRRRRSRGAGTVASYAHVGPSQTWRRVTGRSEGGRGKRGLCLSVCCLCLCVQRPQALALLPPTASWSRSRTSCS